jgi:hypothetical protein
VEVVKPAVRIKFVRRMIFGNPRSRPRSHCRPSLLPGKQVPGRVLQQSSDVAAEISVVLAAIASIAIEMVGGNQYRSRELTGQALT